MLNGLIPETPSLKQPDRNWAGRKLKDACIEFESLFLSHLLRSMKRTVPEGSHAGKSPGSKIITSMCDTGLAMELARGGGIGLAEIIYQQLATKWRDAGQLAG